MGAPRAIDPEQRKRVAIVGGGIAGLTAGYFLSKIWDVTLFERSSRLGGNARTYTTRDGIDIDIAVSVFGMAGYPNFYALLDELGIKTDLCLNSYVSAHNLETRQGVYITPDVAGLKAQKLDILRPSRLWSLFRLLSGVRKTRKMLDANHLHGLTVQEALQSVPQLHGDARLIYLCALCLLSSMKAEDIMQAPAEFFVGKLKRHSDMLSPEAAYSVRCVKKGTKSYVDALSRTFADKVRLNANIKKVRRSQSGITVVMQNGEQDVFSDVVFACNADQALALLDDPTPLERELLGVWRYQEGEVVVHRDHSSFPTRDLIQAFNFLYTEKDGNFDTSVSGATWHQPAVASNVDYICTQHPNFPIDDKLVEMTTRFRTPIFDFKSFAAIDRLPSLNGLHHTYYCGSHFGHGLHDDAVSSAMAVVAQLGVPGLKVQ